MTPEQELKKILEELLNKAPSLGLSGIDMTLIQSLLKERELLKKQDELKNALDPSLDPSSKFRQTMNNALNPESMQNDMPNPEATPDNAQYMTLPDPTSLNPNPEPSSKFAERATHELRQTYPQLSPAAPRPGSTNSENQNTNNTNDPTIVDEDKPALKRRLPSPFSDPTDLKHRRR